MLYTKDAVMAIAVFVGQKMADHPDTWRSSVAYLLSELDADARREGYPVVTAANVLEAGAKYGFRVPRDEQRPPQ